jgi:hypothetical protein
MGSSYIPTRDSDLDTWALNFKTLIAATPTDYGLQAADATAITNSFNSWHSAYLAAVNPSTRTKGTVDAKNQQKTSMLGVIRGYAATIRANRAVSNELKIGIGLHIPDTQPTPVPAPSSKPVLSIAKMEQRYQDVKATDELTPNSRARPIGSAGLLLYRAVGDAPVNDPTQAQFLTFVGKPSVHSTFAPTDNGKVATYFARWTNAKGEVGPWSAGLTRSIAA